MKLALFMSALISILFLYSSSSFSLDVLALNDNEREGQVGEINEKNLYELHRTKNNNSIKHIDYVSKIGRALVSGNAISYMWSSLDNFGTNDIVHGISGSYNNWGLTYDAILRVGAELKSISSGIKFGSDFQISVPSVKSTYFERRTALNRGAKVFVATPYGDFSIGYQEGVESIMKLDASSIIAGDESNSWAQHIRGALSEKKNALGYRIYPFILSPGLYSENVFRNNDNAVLSSDDHKDLINNLPLRMNYQSPSFMGLKFGVSYSPAGYEFDLSKKFNKETVIVRYMALPIGNYMKESNKIRIEQDKNFQTGKEITWFYDFFPVFTRGSGGECNIFGSKYEHILSGSVAFNYNYNDIKFSTSVVGEYAHPRLYFNAKDYQIYPLSYDLKGLSIGSVINYNNISFAGAYGYLGRSGFVEKYYYDNVVYRLYERPGNAYYWDIGLSYQYKSYYFSVAYFKSRKSDNVLQDINLGFEYNLLQRQSKVKCKVFSNYHHYRFSEVAILSDKISLFDKVYFYNNIENKLKNGYTGYKNSYYPPKEPDPLIVDPRALSTNNVSRQEKHGCGNVVLIGVKLEF